VSKTFEAIESLLHPPPVNTGWGLFDSLANGLVKVVVGAAEVTIRGAEIIVNGVVRATVSQVMAVVARIASVVGALAYIKKLVEPWRSHMTADPSSTEVRGPPGTVTATVRVTFDAWPSWLVDCANLAGQTLPDLKPVGARVSGWSIFTTPGGLAHRVRADERLSADATAMLEYRPADDERRGDARQGVMTVTVGIERDDTEQLRQIFLELIQNGVQSLTRSIPGVADLIKQATQPLINQLFAEVREALVKFRIIASSVEIPIIYYQEPDDEDEPAPGVTPAGPGGDEPGGAGTGCPYGTWQWPAAPGIEGRYTWTIQPDGVMRATYHDMRFGIVTVTGTARVRFTDRDRAIHVSDVDASGLQAAYVPGTATGSTPEEMYQELAMLLYGWSGYTCTGNGNLSIVILSPTTLEWAQLSAGDRVDVTLTPAKP
jgi:hypothetical protein